MVTILFTAADLYRGLVGLASDLYHAHTHPIITRPQQSVIRG